VLVDICKPHGFWFDAGELGRIVKFVMRGGLVEAQKRERRMVERDATEKRVQAIALSPVHDAPRDFGSGWVGDLLRALVRWVD
jgi:hypothetical protein